jgi:hypothetical protein
VGGQHLHHYMWGIGLLSGVGAVAAAGSYFAALPVIRRLRHDRRDGLAAS